MNIEVKSSIKPVDYVESMKILERRVNDVFLEKKKELLWILEHNTVYTSGTSAKDEDILNKNLQVIKTKRGGKITLHSPGQKVIYFVLNLNKRKRDVRKLITQIENCIILTLNEFNLDAYKDSKNIGIWINNKKIAAIGIRIKKWIAYHGFSLNINNDLDRYKEIVPCGIRDKEITSLKNLGIKNYSNIEKIIIKNFLNIFL